ncbi:MAG: hypothetical protein MUE69_28695 [Myxococcota bacterium]|jgi:hypothetical protein|nr:hypothetical protein [Myxococcota bacterium]
MKLLVAGEGPTELGDRAQPPQYRKGREGVLEVLLARVLEGVEYEICDAVVWSRLAKEPPGRRIVSYRVGMGTRGEGKTVLKLALRAFETKLDAVAFVRDRDRDEERQKVVDDAIREAAAMFEHVKVVGGVAVEAIEAWALAARDERDCERHARPKDHFEGSVVDVLREADLDVASRRSPSLREWLGRARTLRDATSEK